jgi:CheY-like chemotaxis protein
MTVKAVIVDDNAEFLGAARDLLGREGIVVVGVASTGAEAVLVVQEHDPDVVLVDVVLGDENGFDVADRLSEAAGRRTPVVLVSTYRAVDLEDLIDASAAIGFVSKPGLSAKAILELLDRGDRTDPMR